MYVQLHAVSAAATGLISSSSGCKYPGDTLTYECTVEGGVATVWKGSVFDLCEKSDYRPLLHTRDYTNSSKVQYVECDNITTVVLQAIASDNNTMNHTSYATIIAHCKLDGLTIVCLNDNGSEEIMVGNITITGKNIIHQGFL